MPVWLEGQHYLGLFAKNGANENGGLGCCRTRVWTWEPKEFEDFCDRASEPLAILKINSWLVKVGARLWKWCHAIEALRSLSAAAMTIESIGIAPHL
jgi:hypothetical protein